MSKNFDKEIFNELDDKTKEKVYLIVGLIEEIGDVKLSKYQKESLKWIMLKTIDKNL